MNGVPLPQVCEIEKLRREIMSGASDQIPEDCYAIRTSYTGEIKYLTEQEYNDLINNQNGREE